jgi:hypothetical protein
MPRSSSIAQDIISRQERMLRLAERDHDLTLSVLHAETGISKQTLSSWKNDVAMPAWALVVLSQIIPDHLVSLLFEPVGRCVVTCEHGDGDLDALAKESAGYNVEYLDARSPNSEGGHDLSPREKANLKDRSRRIAAVARRAAA